MNTARKSIPVLAIVSFAGTFVAFFAYNLVDAGGRFARQLARDLSRIRAEMAASKNAIEPEKAMVEQLREEFTDGMDSLAMTPNSSSDESIGLERQSILLRLSKVQEEGEFLNTLNKVIVGDEPVLDAFDQTTDIVSDLLTSEKSVAVSRSQAAELARRLANLGLTLRELGGVLQESKAAIDKERNELRDERDKFYRLRIAVGESPSGQLKSLSTVIDISISGNQMCDASLARILGLIRSVSELIQSEEQMCEIEQYSIARFKAS